MPNILTPVGRLVAGSVYNANDKDFQGNPLTIKTGPNAGQPRIEYFFAIAIAKAGEQHWAETAWGQEIWNEGHAGFPGGEAQRADFAWKITDGDSAIPNRRGVAPNTKTGYPGHWVLSFSSGFAPGLYQLDAANQAQQIMQPDFIKTGYYVQVAGSVGGNNNPGNPGVYLNHSMVCFMGYGDVISSGPDANQAGFGGALPQGASATPPAGAFNPAPPAAPAAPAPGVAPVPGIAPAPGVAPAGGYPGPASGAGYPAAPAPGGYPAPAAAPAPQVPTGQPGLPPQPPAAQPAPAGPAAQYAPSAGVAPGAPSAAGGPSLTPPPGVPNGYMGGPAQ